MSYYHRAAGRAQGNMLTYAMSCLEKTTSERVVKAHKKAMAGIRVYIILLLSLLLVPLFFLGKISMSVFMICICVGIASPAINSLCITKLLGKNGINM